MTFEEIRDAIKVWVLNRPEATNPLIEGVINKVYLSLAMPFRFHEVETEMFLTTMAGQRDYTLSTGTLYALKEAYDKYYGNSLDVVDVNVLDRQVDYEDMEGRPSKVARFGTGVRFDIAPDFSETDIITLRGVNLPAKMTSPTAVPVYPEDWHWIIELQAGSVVAFMLGMEERGQLLQNIALGQLSGRQEPHTIEAFTKQMQLMTGYRNIGGEKPIIK